MLKKIYRNLFIIFILYTVSCIILKAHFLLPKIPSSIQSDYRMLNNSTRYISNNLHILRDLFEQLHKNLNPMNG